MRPLLLFLLAAGFTNVSGQPPPGYYDATYLLSGPQLKAALYGIISPHTVHTYAQLWDDFEDTDARDDNGKVWDIYSDNPAGAEPYLYTFGTDQCGTYDSEGDCYNREHSVPQSWFNGASPMYTDLHHLYPVDGWVNNKRGELPYGEVGSADWTGQNGTRTGNSVTPGYNNTVCEPIDAYKGDLARTYFYMMTRYMNVVDDWTSDMFVNGDLTIWAENMLLQWHVDDPVSQKEIDRNNAVYAVQNNRNPFIDHPEWAHSIWGPFAGMAEPGTEGAFWYAEHALHRSPSVDRRMVVITDASGRQVHSALFSTTILALPDLPPGVFIARAGDRWLRFVL